MENKPKKKQLGKLLAYENANQKCQKAVAPIRETGTIFDYLKACRSLGSETQKMQMLAKTMVAVLRKKMKDALHVEIKTIKKGTVLRKLIKKPPKICPRCCRGMHWAKECKSKFDIEGKPIPENSKQETPQVPFNKNQGQIPSFPSNRQHLAVLPLIYQP